MSKYITAYYLDEEDLMKGLEEIQDKGVKIAEVLTPFPVHGLDRVIGMKRSRLSRVAFIGGAIGAIIGFGFQAWVFTIDYPINFGGKPFLAVPSFIPVTFEMAVLFAAFSMVFAYLITSGLGPGANPVIHHERITDDHFLMVINTEKQNEEEISEIETILQDAGALGITLKS